MDKYDSFIGKVLDGRYKILEMLGVGGMAFVLKAEDLMMNRIVAIKILNDQYNGDEQAETRFINESKPVAMLSHKNIVSVYDVAHLSRYEVYRDGIPRRHHAPRNTSIKKARSRGRRPAFTSARSSARSSTRTARA